MAAGTDRKFRARLYKQRYNFLELLYMIRTEDAGWRSPCRLRPVEISVSARSINGLSTPTYQFSVRNSAYWVSFGMKMIGPKASLSASHVIGSYLCNAVAALPAARQAVPKRVAQKPKTPMAEICDMRKKEIDKSVWFHRIYFLLDFSMCWYLMFIKVLAAASLLQLSPFPLRCHEERLHCKLNHRSHLNNRPLVDTSVNKVLCSLLLVQHE